MIDLETAARRVIAAGVQYYSRGKTVGLVPLFDAIADLRAALDQPERRCWCGHPFAGHQKSGDPRFTETICNGCNDDLIRLNDAGLGVCHEPSEDRPDQPDDPPVIPREVEPVEVEPCLYRSLRAIDLVRRLVAHGGLESRACPLHRDASAFLREIDGKPKEGE